MGFQEFAHVGNEIRLQTVELCDAQLAHLLLAERTTAPTGLCGLIASDVDVLRGEDFHHFFQYVLQEIIGGHAARAEICLLVGLMGAAELRIGSQHLLTVGRHFNLGDYGDAALGSIFHQSAQLILGVVTSASTVGPLVHILSTQGIIHTAELIAAIPPSLP